MVLNGTSQIGKSGSITHEIDLKKGRPDLQNGLYYLMIDFDDKTYTKKLLIN